MVLLLSFSRLTNWNPFVRGWKVPWNATIDGHHAAEIGEGLHPAVLYGIRLE